MIPHLTPEQTVQGLGIALQVVAGIFLAAALWSWFQARFR